MLAQTLSEDGVVASIAGELRRLRSQIEVYIGEGNAIYLLIAIAALVLWFLYRTRR